MHHLSSKLLFRTKIGSRFSSSSLNNTQNWLGPHSDIFALFPRPKYALLRAIVQQFRPQRVQTHPDGDVMIQYPPHIFIEMPQIIREKWTRNRLEVVSEKKVKQAKVRKSERELA